MPMKTILKVCGGLVIIPQCSNISLIHITVHAWLRNRGLARTHEDIAGACLAYISLSVLPSGPVRSAELADARMRKFPFLSYAAQHWRAHVPKHVCLGPPKTPDHLHAMVNDFFSSASLSPAAFQVAIFSTRSNDLAIRSATFDSMPTGQTTLHCAAFWDMPDKVHELLGNGFDVNAADSQSWTALHWAVFARKEAAIRALLEGGAEVNARDAVGWTPLFWAALHGDAPIAHVLLENKTFHLIQDKHGWTALRWAASRQNVPVMTLLLEHHSKSKETLERLPLHCLDSLTIQQLVPLSSGLLGEITDVGVHSRLDDKEIERLYEVLVSGTLKADDLWGSGHFDPPVDNAWRTEHKIVGWGRYDYAGPLPRDGEFGSEKASWQARLLRSAIQDGNLAALRILLGLEVDPNLHQHLASPLHSAAMRKDPRFAELLLNFGADVNSKGSDSLTPLQRALLHGFEETARLFVINGADVNARTETVLPWYNTAQIPPLILTFGRECDSDERIRLVRLLLEHGADTKMTTPENCEDFGNPGMTVMHYASNTRDAELIQLVAQAGGDPKALDASGWTAMHHFVYWRTATGARKNTDFSVAQLLLSICGTGYLNRTAEIAINYPRSRCNHTPPTIAIAQKDWAMARALQTLGARFETNMPLNALLLKAVKALENEMVELLLHHGARLVPGELEQSWTWQICLTALEAIGPPGLARFESVIRQINSIGVDINTETADVNLLHCLLGRQGKEREPVPILLDAGANPYITNKEGLDAFLVAAVHGKDAILDTLLSYASACPDQSHWTYGLSRHDGSGSGPGWTTIYHVCEALHVAGQINRIYGKGTLLHETALHGREELFRALLQNHADPTIGDHVGRRPIHVASNKGHTTIVDLLMCANGADVNVLDDGHRSCLHMAAEGGHIETVEKLISYGADVNVLDGKQRSPIHLAAMRGHTETIETLLSHGAAPGLADTYGLHPLHFAAWRKHVPAARVLLRMHSQSAFVQTHSISRAKDFRIPIDLQTFAEFEVTPLHVAAKHGDADMVRCIIDAVKQTTGQDVATLVRPRTVELRELRRYRVGPTALHMFLSWGETRRRKMLSRPRLETARILIDHGADVTGVANHFTRNDVSHFAKFPDLIDVWERLRVGLTNAERPACSGESARDEETASLPAEDVA